MKILGPESECRELMQSLGAVDPTRLESSRLFVHWAIQVVSSVGFTVVEPGEDFEHTTLRYRDPMLLGRPTLKGLRAAFAFDDATLRLVSDQGATLERTPVSGATLEQLYGTLVGWLAGQGHDVAQMQRPAHDMPEHPVASGAPFGEPDFDALRELGNWLDLARVVVEAVAASDPRFGEAMLWPHHFDTAALMRLTGESTVGVGLTPGDPGCPQPYVYVTPWPSVASSDLPPLAGAGGWHTQGWVGAILRADQITAVRAPQRWKNLDDFLSSAIEASLKLKGQR